MTVNYREGYNLFACNGVLFNHESPRRGETFVTRKITRAVANILKGNQKTLYLGNLSARRDWGFAPEYVEMMWLMLQQETPDDYVVGTGKSATVREFVDKAFSYMGVTLEWQGTGAEELGIVRSSTWSHLTPGTVLVQVDPRYFRPTEVEALQADISKAREKLGWAPRVTLDELVKVMIDCDVRSVGLEAPGRGLEASRRKGFDYTNHDFSMYEQIREH
jgi:GDPmannose 4,6-dehydratase